MLDNNLLSLKYHVLLLLAFIVVANVIPYTIVLFICIFGVLIAYFYIGMVLSPQKNIVLNFLSVSSIAIIGVILWLICYLIYTLSSDPLSDVPFAFLIYYSNSMGIKFLLDYFHLVDDISFDNSFLQVSFMSVFIPSILIWLGMSCKLLISKIGNYEES